MSSKTPKSWKSTEAQAEKEGEALMPKKKTYEQLERALKQVEKDVARKDRGWDSAAKACVDLGKERDTFRAGLVSATARADRAEKKAAELEELARQLKISTLLDEAEAAELNCVAFRAVSLGLLDALKIAATPIQFIKPPGLSLSHKNYPRPDSEGGP